MKNICFAKYKFIIKTYLCVTYSDLWVDVIVDADDTRVYLHHRFYGNLKAQTTHLRI